MNRSIGESSTRRAARGRSWMEIPMVRIFPSCLRRRSSASVRSPTIDIFPAQKSWNTSM
jgi:hypothetical protein